MRKEIIRIPTPLAKSLFATANPSAFSVCIGKKNGGRYIVATCKT